jgi:hypothetical protein
MVFGFFARLISFFTGGFKKETPVIRTSVENIPMLIEKSFLLQKEELEELTAKKLSELKYVHSRAVGIVNDIDSKELEGKPNERLNKAALTAKNQIVNQLRKILQKSNPADRGKTLDDARHYCGESYSILATELVAFRKNIAYTSFYFKDEMKGLGESLQEMLNSLHELNEAYKKAGELFDFEKTKESVGIVLRKKKEFNELMNDKKRFNEELSGKEENAVGQQNKIGGFKTGEEMGAYSKLEEEMTALMSQKQDLKTEISALLLNIDRPLQRFKQLVDSGRWKIPAEEKDMLDLFVTNPMAALKKDPKADVFKKVLGEIIKAIEDGAIELKEREKEKRLSALQEIINFDFFGSVFWKMNEIQRKQIEMNKLIEKNESKKKLTLEEGKLNDIGKEIEEIKDNIETIEKKEAAIKAEIENDLNRIKIFSEKVLKKTVILEEETW